MAEIANIEESPISLKDVLIILTVLAAVLLMVNLNVLPMVWSIMMPLLIWTAITDIKIRIIPNTVPVVLLVFGLYQDPTAAVGGLFGCFFCLLPLYVLNGMGGGDLKLAAGIGAAVGYAGGITIIFYSSLLALVYIVIVKFIRKEIGGFIRDSLFSIKTFGQVKYEMPVKADEIMKATVPLGAFFLPGALFYLLKGGF